jgi:hypothetical protein
MRKSTDAPASAADQHDDEPSVHGPRILVRVSLVCVALALLAPAFFAADAGSEYLGAHRLWLSFGAACMAYAFFNIMLSFRLRMMDLRRYATLRSTCVAQGITWLVSLLVSAIVFIAFALPVTVIPHRDLGDVAHFFLGLIAFLVVVVCIFVIWSRVVHPLCMVHWARYAAWDRAHRPGDRRGRDAGEPQ